MFESTPGWKRIEFWALVAHQVLVLAGLSILWLYVASLPPDRWNLGIAAGASIFAWLTQSWSLVTYLVQQGRNQREYFRLLQEELQSSPVEIVPHDRR